MSPTTESGAGEFEFTPENLQHCQELIGRYPQKRAAMLPVLHLAQHQHGHISQGVEAAVAELLEVPAVEVHQVVTFYTLYHRKPVGRHMIRLCACLSCWLRGSDEIQKHLAEKLGVPSGATTDGGRVTWEAVSDCLGACEQAPMLQLDKDFHGPLTKKMVDELLAGLD